MTFSRKDHRSLQGSSKRWYRFLRHSDIGYPCLPIPVVSSEVIHSMKFHIPNSLHHFSYVSHSNLDGKFRRFPSNGSLLGPGGYGGRERFVDCLKMTTANTIAESMTSVSEVGRDIMRQFVHTGLRLHWAFVSSLRRKLHSHANGWPVTNDYPCGVNKIVNAA